MASHRSGLGRAGEVQEGGALGAGTTQRDTDRSESMKVRHIRRKPWLRKGPEHRAWKRLSRSMSRQREHHRQLMLQACRAYMRPVC
jgi:hypothetical protein